MQMAVRESGIQNRALQDEFHSKLSKAVHIVMPLILNEASGIRCFSAGVWTKVLRVSV